MGEVFGTHFTSDIIKKNTTCSLKEMRKIIIKADKKMTIKKCGEKTPMIAKVAESPGWVRVVGSHPQSRMESSARSEDAEQGH